MQQQDGLGVRRALVDVVHAQPVGQRRRSAGRRGTRAGRRSASSGVRTHLHGAQCAAPLARGVPSLMDSWRDRGALRRGRRRCRPGRPVPRLRAGLPGRSRSRSSTPAHPGRATDAGAGILSPATSHETDAALWPFLRQAGAHYPALLRRMAERRRRRGRDRLRRLRAALARPARARGPWFAPFAEIALQRRARRGRRDHTRGGAPALPAARPGAPGAASPVVGTGRRARHGGRVAERRVGAVA